MNYGQLKEAIASYGQRRDLASMFPTFLALAEQRIYFGESAGGSVIAPRLRHSSMVAQANMVDGTLPAGFLEAKRITPDGLSDPLGYLPLDRIARGSNAFSYQGQTLVLSDDIDFPLALVYYQRYTALTDDASTNWLLTNAPNVYLTSMLVEFARWSRDDALGAREAANYLSAINALEAADDAATHSGAPLYATLNTAEVV